MRKIIFYSWQSDLPNATNRGCIQKALEKAAKAISGDESIDVEPVVDRDTAGVAGSPDIAGTILNKIAAADVFVPDVSLITPADFARRCPNPNVLLELGFAINALGWPRIVMVMNTAFGPPSDLPFDLRGRRVVPYALADAAEGKTEQRKQLEARLKLALRGVFEHQTTTAGAIVVAPLSLEEQAIHAIEAAAPDRTSVVRRFMKHIDQELVEIAPDLTGDSPDFQRLKDGLDAALPAVIAYGRVASRAAVMQDTQSLPELYRGLEAIAQRYEFQGGGSYYQYQFDFWRFIGYELLVMLAACMIQENLWESLSDVLDRSLILEHTNAERRNVPYSDLCSGVVLCDVEGGKRQRLSLRADLLRERHVAEPLASVVGITAFMEADYFLFLRAELAPENPDGRVQWVPESAIFLKQPPRYLVEAQRIGPARRLAAAIGVDRPETLRDRLLERHARFGRCFPRARWPPSPFEDDMDVIHKLGSR